jgi:hypothetical protein
MKDALASRSAELLLHFDSTIADSCHDLLELGWRNIESFSPSLHLPTVLHIDLRPIGLDGLGERGHRCAPTKIAAANSETANPNDMSSASRSSFLFRRGWFCAI